MEVFLIKNITTKLYIKEDGTWTNEILAARMFTTYELPSAIIKQELPLGIYKVDKIFVKQ